MAALDVVFHWLHLMAAVAWLGGMIFTAFLLGPVLRARLTPEARLPLIREVGLRFKHLEWSCLAILIGTGTWKIATAGPLAAVFDGAYGRVLVLKLHLVAAMLVLSALHTFAWGPRLAELRPGTQEQAALTRRVVFWARVNLGLGLAVVFCAALLRMNPF